MAFFPRSLYNSGNDASFTPLFRLLDDFDSYSRQNGGSSSPGRRHAAAVLTFQPKFDIRETGEAYELHGELPGMEKENLTVEFTEPQTMLVRGKVERTYTAGTPPNAQQLEGSSSAGAIEGSTEKRRNSHQATVEDESAAQSSEVSEDKVEDGQQVTKTAQKPAAPADKAKYWLTERSIGEFSRTFSFPTRVEQDAVAASLKDGILTVTVPKAKKHETRRINIA